MKWFELIGRLLLVQLFLIAGIHKITAYAGTQGYMESMGVPACFYHWLFCWKSVAA